MEFDLQCFEKKIITAHKFEIFGFFNGDFCEQAFACDDGIVNFPNW